MDGTSCIGINAQCGDGTRQDGEACDDGNIFNNDGCNSTCSSNERCGNLYTDEGLEEVCDDGNTLSGDGCSSDCKSKEICGNRVVDLARGEVCDDGNENSGDKCSASCRSAEICGNFITDVGEVCDDGNTSNGDGCSADCTSGEKCGNGIRDEAEECDDGNALDTDDCIECKLARCGDGFKDSLLPITEQCDPKFEPAACTANCTISRCGDGIVNTRANEQCDNVGAVNSKTCDADCTVAYCGDGFPNSELGEECDGESNCLPNCKFNRCGNGSTEPWEVCDDGNADACGRCNATCSGLQFARASGRIMAAQASNIQDRETFSVSDGKHLPVVFEFEKRDGVSNRNHVLVDISGVTTPVEVGSRIHAAIQSARGRFSFEVNSTHNATEAHVELRNDYNGGYGNQRIIDTVGNSDFIVSGMSGGQGRDCPVNMGCTDADDCAPGLQCNAGKCK